MLGVGDGEQRLETAENAVAAPVLCQLDGGARKIARVALELLLELLKQRESVGGGAGEARQELSAAQSTHLHRIRLHNGIADGHLAVAAQGDFAIPAYCQNGRGANPASLTMHRSKLTGTAG